MNRTKLHLTHPPVLSLSSQHESSMSSEAASNMISGRTAATCTNNWMEHDTTLIKQKCLKRRPYVSFQCYNFMTHQVRCDVFRCYLVQHSVQYVAIELSSGHRVISVGGGGGVITCHSKKERISTLRYCTWQ